MSGRMHYMPPSHRDIVFDAYHPYTGPRMICSMPRWGMWGLLPGLGFKIFSNELFKDFAQIVKLFYTLNCEGMRYLTFFSYDPNMDNSIE